MSGAEHNGQPPAPIDRLLQLLADRSTQGLDADRELELDGLLRQFPDLDDQVFDWTVAALELAFELPHEEMPDDVAVRAIEQGEDFIARAQASVAPAQPVSPRSPLDSSDLPMPAELASAPAPPAEPAAIPTETAAEVAASVESTASTQPAEKSFAAPPKKRGRRSANSSGSWIGWLAAAACLALAITAWWPRLQPGTPPSLAEQRAELLQSHADAILLKWQVTDDPAAAGGSGDVVWSNRAQQGFMRFSGIEPNEPADRRYQLWIIDVERDERYPVDGGVFDIPVTADEVIVPITPKLPVGKPALFAVTLEPPNGVVVSERKRMVVTAAPP